MSFSSESISQSGWGYKLIQLAPLATSAFGTTRTSESAELMSAFGGKADITRLTLSLYYSDPLK